MIVSAHQPAYNPWLGYFDKIKRSDVFVFLDTVQFEKNSFTNRNKIKSANGPVWLTVPVIKTNHFEMIMKDMLIDNRSNWQKKHLNSIFLSYKKSPYFSDVFPKLEKLYSKSYEFFVDMSWDHLLFWLDFLGIDTKIVKSSDLGITSKKSDLVFDICKEIKADKYISGALGIDYLDTDRFKESGIDVEFQNYVYPEYNQMFGDFIPNLGIIDFVMNESNYSII